MIDRDKAFPTGMQKLVDGFGGRTVYDAVSQCSRCGYCEQSCPTYVVSGDEKMSPRGRNQLVRMLLEGKVKDEASAAASLDTCLLCSSCSTTCYASVPTADLVLEGRRYLARKAPVARLRSLVTGLLFERPRALANLLRLANLARWGGLDKLAALLRLPRLLGLKPLELAAWHVRSKPLRFLSERLAKRPGLDAAAPAWNYWPACGSEYLFPEVGEASVAVLERFHGPGRLAAAGCCGLVAYNYGELDAARAQARKVIERFEAAPGGEAPVVGDCSSCVAHLKDYPKLFVGDEVWEPRATALAARVRDFIEMAAPEKVEEHCAKPRNETPVTVHHSCRALHGQGLSQGTERAVRAAAGASKFTPLGDAFWCCGGAGAYAFTEPELSDRVLQAKARAIADTHAETVVASSTSCLIQLAHGLKKYYPEARVTHLSRYLVERLRG